MRVLSVLADLLSYPNENFQRALVEAKSLLAELKPEDAELLRRFIDYVEAADPYELQELYVKTFDFSEETTLYLTYHLYGDNRERGRALAELISIYRRYGACPPTGDLPDYLPHLLKLMASAPEAAAELSHLLSKPIEKILKGLNSSPYFYLIKLIQNIIGC
ncbi:MAG: nitrate reductase molybdenum cofactor assembly chaperone [Thermoproteus sp.]